MNSNGIQYMLNSIVIERNVDREALCKGLCSVSAMSRYLCGESQPDRLLLTVLLQRLGMSPDKYATLLNYEEYIYFLWKQSIGLAQINRDWKEMELLLQEEEARKRTTNETLQEQYYLLLQGIVQAKLHDNIEKAKILIEQAICLTVPDFPCLTGKKLLLGMQEISAMLLWYRLQMKEEFSIELLRYLLEYVGRSYPDEQEQVKLYPKIAKEYLRILLVEERYIECIAIADRAIQMMQKTGYASCMEDIVETYVEAVEKLGLGERVYKKKIQVAVCKELMRELIPGANGLDDEIYMLEVWQEIELVDEVIGLGRRERGYSQEYLSEDICAPETVSRIESGRRAPSRKNYAAMARKLGLRDGYFYSCIETDDYHILEKTWEITKYIMNGEWKKTEEMLHALQKEIDLTSPYNQQYIQSTQCIIDAELGRLSVKEQYEKFLKILGLTMKAPAVELEPEDWSKDFWIHAFSKEEMSILIQLSDVLLEQGKIHQAIWLLEGIMNFYRSSKVAIEFHYRTILMVVQRLSILKEMLNQYEEALLYSEEGIRLSFVGGNLFPLSGFINNKADAMEHLGLKEASLQYYKLAFYYAELMQSVSAPVSKRSYEKLIGHQVEWY